MRRYMKILKRLAVVLALFYMLAGSFGEFTVMADGIPDDGITEEDIMTEEDAESVEKLSFRAKVEWSNEGWIVKGSFPDMTSDMILVQPMSSTDGETYRDSLRAWNLDWLSSGEETAQEKLRNQRCLYDSEEPFKSYLSGELDRFFVKLRVVRESGTVCETEAAVIERGDRQAEAAEIDMMACFAPSMLVREGRPPRIKYYGRYQLTVREDSNVEGITEALPDTLPVEVQLHNGADCIGDVIVDCPVRWKPLEPLQLTAGESVTVPDAAEEIVVPAGTVLHTQTGIYRVEEPISLDQNGIMTDEVSLVFNVIAKDGQPEGMLREENYGLDMAFSLKPTGVTAIRAYVIREDDTAWMEIAGLSLTDMVDAQPSTANSGYATVLEKEQEPYRSYREAQEAGEKPEPFMVGIMIEGGVYDGRQLVLAWPDTYDPPLNLPKMGGSGGNEGNAGSDNRGDSGEGGQRPGLQEEETQPPATEEKKEPEQQSVGEQRENSDNYLSKEKDVCLAGESSVQRKEGTVTSVSEELPVEETDHVPVPKLSGTAVERMGRSSDPGPAGLPQAVPVGGQAKVMSGGAAESDGDQEREELVERIPYEPDKAGDRTAKNSVPILFAAIAAFLLAGARIVSKVLTEKT